MQVLSHQSSSSFSPLHKSCSNPLGSQQMSTVCNCPVNVASCIAKVQSNFLLINQPPDNFLCVAGKWQEEEEVNTNGSVCKSVAKDHFSQHKFKACDFPTIRMFIFCFYKVINRPWFVNIFFFAVNYTVFFFVLNQTELSCL